MTRRIISIVVLVALLFTSCGFGYLLVANNGLKKTNADLTTKVTNLESEVKTVKSQLEERGKKETELLTELALYYVGKDIPTYNESTAYETWSAETTPVEDSIAFTNEHDSKEARITFVHNGNNPDESRESIVMTAYTVWDIAHNAEDHDEETKTVYLGLYNTIFDVVKERVSDNVAYDKVKVMHLIIEPKDESPRIYIATPREEIVDVYLYLPVKEVEKKVEATKTSTTTTKKTTSSKPTSGNKVTVQQTVVKNPVCQQPNCQQPNCNTQSDCKQPNCQQPANGKTLTSINVTYIGGDKEVGTYVGKSEIIVVAKYSDGSSRTLSADEFALASGLVEKEFINKLTVTHCGMSATVTVNGYKKQNVTVEKEEEHKHNLVPGPQTYYPLTLSVSYGGSSKRVGSTVGKSDLTVVASGRTLAAGEYQLVSSSISKTGANTITVAYTYGGRTYYASCTVNGYRSGGGGGGGSSSGGGSSKVDTTIPDHVDHTKAETENGPANTDDLPAITTPITTGNGSNGSGVDTSIPPISENVPSTGGTSGVDTSIPPVSQNIPGHNHGVPVDTSIPSVNGSDGSSNVDTTIPSVNGSSSTNVDTTIPSVNGSSSTNVDTTIPSVKVVSNVSDNDTSIPTVTSVEKSSSEVDTSIPSIKESVADSGNETKSVDTSVPSVSSSNSTDSGSSSTSVDTSIPSVSSSSTAVSGSSTSVSVDTSIPDIGT